MEINKKKVNWIIAGVMVVLIGLLAWAWTSNVNIQRSNNNWKHNYEVLQDSVSVIKTKHDEVLFENGSLIIEKRDLQEALDISKQQVRDYEKALGSKLAYISKLEAQLKIKDTVYVTEVVHDTLTNSYRMSYCDDWLKFDENFSLLDPNNPVLKVYNIDMNVPLKVGLGGDYKIFVTSPNPYFNVTSIEGAVIDGSRFEKKISRWTLGAYGGFGFQYGLITKQIDVGPQVGVGVGFRFF
jgi:hypothetical protein